MYRSWSRSSWLSVRLACGCLQDDRLECLQSTRHNLAFTSSRHSRLFLPRDQEIIIPVYLSLRRRCHSEISAGTPEASVGAARCRGCDPPALQTLSRSTFLSGLRFIRLLFKWWTLFFFSHLPAVHTVYLSRCSPGDSRYLQHPPIICFTSLPTPPSPMLASPLILDRDPPSASQRSAETHV